MFSNHCLDRAAKEWRCEVAYRVMVLLKAAMAVIDYPSTSTPAWDIPELTGEEEQYVRNASFALSADARRWAHGKRSEWEETMRVPIHIAYLLRKSIHAQQQRLRTPLQLAQENKLLGSVDSFMSGYYGMRKFLTTYVSYACMYAFSSYVPVPFLHIVASTAPCPFL